MFVFRVRQPSCLTTIIYVLPFGYSFFKSIKNEELFFVFELPTNMMQVILLKGDQLCWRNVVIDTPLRKRMVCSSLD